jgi:hypothetical protein
MRDSTAGKESAREFSRPSGTRSLFPTFPSAEALGYYRLPFRGMNLSV